MSFKTAYLNAVLGLAIIGGTVGGSIGLIQDCSDIYNQKVSKVEYVAATRFTPPITSDNPGMDRGILNGAVIGGVVGLAGLLMVSILPDNFLNDGPTRFKKE